MMMNDKKSRPNWSELNKKLLEVIASKLSYVEILRFKAVCTSWFAATKRFSSGPLLILPSTSETDEKHVRLGAFSCKDKTTYDLNLVLEKPEDISLSESKGVRFLGSSHGWLVAEGNNSELCLLNLFSRICIPLPGKGKIPITNLFQSRTQIQKAILTANPSSDENYKAIIIYGLRHKLAFCGCGDEEWVGFSNSDGYADVLSYNMMLYTLREGAQIEVWDFSDSCFPTKKVSVECCYTTNLSFPSDISSTQWYLVPSMGEILFIVRYIGEFVNHKGELLSEADLLTDEDIHPLVCPYRTFKFQVYKLDMIGKKLEEVKSLKDQVIFVGINNGISVAAKDYQEFKPNSIYFTDDYLDRLYEDYLYGGHDFGFFSLEDERIGSIFESDFVERFDPAPFWVFPN